jgi:arsenate reductase
MKDCREVKGVLAENGLDYETVHYLEQSLSAKRLRQLLGSAGLKPREAIRNNESAYREHVEGRNLSDGQLIELMAQYPELISKTSRGPRRQGRAVKPHRGNEAAHTPCFLRG